jgi:gluconolactonase
MRLLRTGGSVPSAVVLACIAVSAQRDTNTLVRLDPSFDVIVSPNANIEVLKTGLPGTAEGPLWVDDGASGYLLFSDLRANQIFKWTPDRNLSVFLDKTGWNGPETAATNFGSNGITLDRQGRLLWVAQGDRAVIRREKDGSRTVLADRYQGKRFNRPNDIVVKTDDAIYFTDQETATNELDFDGVFRFSDGTLQVLEKDFRPNGLAFSPDERYLYVNGTAASGPRPPAGGGKFVYRYDVMRDGTLANRRILIDMSSDSAPGNADGMKVDQRGNVYCTGPGGLWIVSPEGKHLGTILTPDPIGPLTNVAFGDPDGKTLYLTGRGILARIRANVPGVRPGLPTSVGGRTK